MTTTHYRIGNAYLGGFGDGASPSESAAIECPAPGHGNDVWSGTGWDAKVMTTPERSRLASDATDDDMNTPLMKTIAETLLSGPGELAQFRASLMANHRTAIT